MIVVLMNDMRASQIEIINPRFRAETREQANTYLETQLADEPYRDTTWHKVYKRGSPLEWMNAPWSSDDHRHFQDIGTEDEWASNARRSYQEQIMSLPLVP